MCVNDGKLYNFVISHMQEILKSALQPSSTSECAQKENVEKDKEGSGAATGRLAGVRNALKQGVKEGSDFLGKYIRLINKDHNKFNTYDNSDNIHLSDNTFTNFSIQEKVPRLQAVGRRSRRHLSVRPRATTFSRHQGHPSPNRRPPSKHERRTYRISISSNRISQRTGIHPFPAISNACPYANPLFVCRILITI